MFLAPGAGVHTIRARAGEWDSGSSTDVFGDWASLSFTLDPTVKLAPTI